MNNIEEKKKIILYEDQDIIVCRKPAGVPVQTAEVRGKDMVSILKNYRSETESMQMKKTHALPEIYVVHRLDQPVEGVMVFAKNRKAASELSCQVTDGRMKKVYQAVCCAEYPLDYRFSGKNPNQNKNADTGREKLEEGQKYALTDYLIKNRYTNTSEAVSAKCRDAKEARLEFCILKSQAAGENKEILLTEIYLDTGRHHQIRVQMAHAGLPLAGDRKYFSEWQMWPGSEALALCSVSLSFFHPSTGRQLTFQTKPQSAAFSLFYV